MNHKKIVEDAFELVKPSISKLLKERGIREDMHIVVMNPTLKPWESSFEDAILKEFSLTDKSNWVRPFHTFALDKAKQTWRDGRSNTSKHLLAPATLKDGDVAFYGSFEYEGVIVAASGVQPWFDHLVSAWLALAIQQLCQDEYQQFKSKEDNNIFIN